MNEKQCTEDTGMLFAAKEGIMIEVERLSNLSRFYTTKIGLLRSTPFPDDKGKKFDKIDFLSELSIIRELLHDIGDEFEYNANKLTELL